MPSVGSTPTTTSPAPQQQQQQQFQLQQQQQMPQQPLRQQQHPKQQQPQQQPQRLKQHNSVKSTSSTKSVASSSTTTTKSMTAPNHHQQQQQQQQKQKHHQTQRVKLPQPQTLPLQLQYHHYQPQQPQQHQQHQQQQPHLQQKQPPPPQHMVTTQPSPAGVFHMHQQQHQHQQQHMNNGLMSINGGDISPISSSNSYSSVDTNQTLLNTFAVVNQQQQQHPRQSSAGYNKSSQRTNNSSSNNSKYSQFMIVTPAVSIDRDFEYETGDNEFEDAFAAAAAAAQNGNIFRMSLMQRGGSIDSGNSSDSSFRSNYNSYLHHSRQHLLPKNRSGASQQFYTFTSWRWCTLICAAMRCFGGGHSSNAHYSSSFVRRPAYHRSRSTAAQTSTTPHRRLRSSPSFTAETAFEHFSAPFKPRKTRDHMNNITYEL